MLTNFQNYFNVRIRRKFVIILSLKVPLHLKFATLPREMSSVLKQQFLYALTSSNINQFWKCYLLILLPVPRDVITDVIGIWSVVFESFVYNFVTTRVGCLPCDVVLFSIVAFKTLDISQDSVETHLRCGRIFSDSVITNILLILTVK